MRRKGTREDTNETKRYQMKREIPKRQNKKKITIPMKHKISRQRERYQKGTIETRTISMKHKIPRQGENYQKGTIETRTISMKHKIKRNEITKSMVPDVTPTTE